MDETYGTYADDECFDIHDYDENTDDDTDDGTEDDTNDDANVDTDDGGRGHLYTIKVPDCCFWVPGSCCLSGCRPRRRRVRVVLVVVLVEDTRQNTFLGGTVKKTSGAGSIFLELVTFPNLVFPEGGANSLTALSHYHRVLQG